jgi:hypothetical protein
MWGRAPLLAALLAATLAVAGCGSGDEPTRTSPPTAEQPGPIEIVRPAADAKVKAGEDGGRLGARPSVSGTGDPGATVILNGGCDVQGCVAHVTADDRGRWSSELRLDAPADAPKVRIAAYYRGSVVGPEDRVEVRLVGPKPEPLPRGGRRGGRGGAGPGAAVPPDDLGGPVPVPGPTGGGRTSGTLILVGDSLAVGIEGLLPGLLRGWRVASDALKSRPLAAGMGILARTEVPRGAVIAISLFTNDDPTRLGALEAAVRASVRRAAPGGGCAVWATIARPPFNGRSYAAANALLHRLDAELGRLVVVPWAERAERSGWLASDGVHATPAGYRARAGMYAEAAQSC